MHQGGIPLNVTWPLLLNKVVFASDVVMRQSNKFRETLVLFISLLLKPILVYTFKSNLDNGFFMAFSTFNVYRQTPCDLASLLGYGQCAEYLRSHSCATGSVILI